MRQDGDALDCKEGRRWQQPRVTNYMGPFAAGCRTNGRLALRIPSVDETTEPQPRAVIGVDENSVWSKLVFSHSVVFVR